MAGRNKKYFTSTGLSRITQQKDQEGFVSDVTKQWLGKLSDENREVTEPLIAGIERHKLKEFLTDSEHIDKIFSSVLSPDTFKKKSGFSDPPKMAETYSKLGTNFYKFFEDLVSGKTQKGSSLIENAISYTGEINQMISTKSSFNQISTLTRVIDAARRLKTELNKGNFSVFDIESLGGQNKYGFQELDDITEFAMINPQFNAEGNMIGTKDFRSMIGLTDGDKYLETKARIQKLRTTPEANWTSNDRVLISAYTKYGQNGTKFTPLNDDESLWDVSIDPNYTDEDSTDIDAALRGLDERRRIGKAQERAAAANGGEYAYKKEYAKMINKINSNEGIVAGHNILKFDVPMLNRAADKMGVPHINTENNNFFDLLASMRYITAEKGKDYFYDDIQRLSRINGLSSNAQESLTKYLFGEAEQHSAYYDSKQYMSLFTRDLGQGQTFIDKVLAGLEDINKDTLEYKYKGANKQLFYINNSERFNSYNTRNAMNATFDPISGTTRTANGFAINADGTVDKELFGQNGNMKNRTLAKFNVVKFDTTEEYRRLMNPLDAEDVTIPEMNIKSGYALIVTPYDNEQLANSMGAPYSGATKTSSIYFHDTYDSLLAQMSHAVPIAEDENGVLNPIEENLKKEQMKLFNMVDGVVKDITPANAQQHLEKLQELHMIQYMNEPAADLARKFSMSKYVDIKEAFLNNKASKDEVMESVRKLADTIASGKALTHEVQLATTLGFISKGKPKLYSETINKTANLAGFVYDQMPVFEEIINQIKGFDHMKGNTKEAAENRSIAFTRAYNALVEHLSQDPNEIKNGINTTIVGKDALDYINLKTSDVFDAAEDVIGHKIFGAQDDYTRISLNGGLLKQITSVQGTNKTAITKLDQSSGFALLDKFVTRLNKTEAYKNAVQFTSAEKSDFAKNIDSQYYESAILGKLKAFVNNKRSETPSFGYANETNTTHYVLNPFDLIKKAMVNGKLTDDARSVIRNEIESLPHNFKIYDKDAGINSLVEELMSHMFTLDKTKFEKSLAGMSEDHIKTALYNFDLTKQGFQKYAENIARGIYNSDIKLGVGKDNILAIRDGRFTNLSLPQARQAKGMIYAQIDNTKNALFPYLSMENAVKAERVDVSAIKYISSIEKGIHYSLSSSIDTAYKNERDPLNAFVSWIQNTKKNIREKAPGFTEINPRIMMEQYHQDINELVSTMKYLNNVDGENFIDDLMKKGLLPDDFKTKIRTVLNSSKDIAGYEELNSEASLTIGHYAQTILHALGNHQNIYDPNVRRMMTRANESTKDTNVAAGKIATEEVRAIGGFEYANVGRPPVNQNLDRVMYREDKVRKALEDAGISKHVKIGSYFTNNTQKYLTSVEDELTGKTMVNTFSTNFLLLDSQSFNKMLITEKEKAQNAFTKAAKKISGKKDTANIAEELFQKMLTLNLHEQELIMSAKLSEATQYKSNVQAINVKKKMLVQFEKDTQTAKAVSTYKKLVPVIGPDGTIRYKAGMSLKKKQYILSVDGFGEAQDYFAKRNGTLRYGFFDQYGELIDEADVNKLLKGKNFKDIGQIEEFLDKQSIESKYYLTQDTMNRSKMIIGGVEKGVTDNIFIGAGTLDTDVENMLRNAKLGQYVGVAISDDKLKYLKETGKLNDAQIKKIIAERHLASDVLEDLLDTKHTGILGIVNQAIAKHENTNIALASGVGQLFKAGKLKTEEEKAALKKVFGGTIEVTDDGVNFTKDAYGVPVDIEGFNRIMQKANLVSTVDDKTIYGKTYSRNGVTGTNISAEYLQDNDWNAGSSSSTNMAALREDIENKYDQIRNVDKQLLKIENNEANAGKINSLIEKKNKYFNDLSVLEEQKSMSNAVEKGAVYSDRLGTILNMRGYHEDTMATTRRKLGESEFNKYFGHAYDSTGALSDNYKHSSFLSPWTNQVRDSVYDDERNVDLIKEVRQGMDSIIFNDKNVDKYSIEDMNRKGFRTIPFKDAQFALPGQAHEIVQHENNVYNNDLILDFGRDFGKNRYIATSADKPRFSGDSLIKETRKSQLSTLQSLKQSYDRETSVEEKAKIKDRILNTMQAYKEHEIKNITGKDGKAENLMKIRLENSFNGKASLLPIFRGEGYNGLNVTDRVAQLQKYNADILSKAKVDGKSILEHYAEGKYIDTQYMSEQGLRDMGYFDEKFMRNAFGKQAKGVNNKQLENMMKETMQTTGDIAMLQRFPVIMEKSGTPVRLLMDPRLQGDQTKLLTVTSYGNKADVDGDTVSTSMMKDKDGLTHLRYELATQNGEKVSDSLTKMAKGQEAAMIDHAINLNHSIENKVQDALAKDMENSIMDLSSLGQKNIIDKKLYGAINGVTNITYNDALGHVEKVKQYVEAAQAQLAEAGQKTTGATLHNKVTELIKLENPNNAKAVESLTRSYAISDAYNKLMKEKTSKLLKGAVGEMNLPNKRLREAYFLTANPANEKFVMNTSILQNVLNVTEEAAISAKKATSKVDEARISQWRSYLRNVQDGHDVRGNIGQMKSWLHENMEDDILKVVDDTAESSDVYRNIVKEFGSDKEQIVNHYIDSFGDIMKGMAGNNGIRALQNGFFKFGENKNGITNAKDIIGLSVAAHDETMQGSMVKRLLKDNEIGHVLDRDMFDQTNTFNDTVRSTVADGREWLKDEPSAGQIAQKVLQSTGSVLEKLTSAFDGKTLAMGALGLAGAILVSGFVGGNPAAPAETQAQFQSEDDQQQQTYEEPSLFDYSRSSSQKQKGYVINVRGQTNRDIGHAKTAINNAVSSSMNTNVNVSMNITDATGNINDRYIEQLLAGALN